MRHWHWSTLFAPVTLLHILPAAYHRQATEIYHINWLQCAIPLPNNGVPAVINVLGNDLKLLAPTLHEIAAATRDAASEDRDLSERRLDAIAA